MKKPGPSGGTNPGSKRSTEDEYRRRINLAVGYIQNHLDESPSIEEVASAACFSVYHFHRIFRAFTGESVASYGRRLRLDRAAWQLLHRPELSITDIALSAGFSSSSDFARAFRKRFSVSPTAYRRSNGTADGCRPAANRLPERRMRRIEERAEVVTLPDLTLAWILCTGLSPALRSETIRGAYARLYDWARTRGALVLPARPFGVYLDNPEVTPFDRCRYLACVEVHAGTEAAGEVGVMKPKHGQRYVSYAFLRTSPFFASRFFGTSLYLYRHWIPAHGYVPSDAPILEAYRLRGRRIRYLDILLPVEPYPESRP